jgi:3-hydroxyacyl-[acyl-carrier-protein] dehydratase
VDWSVKTLNRYIEYLPQKPPFLFIDELQEVEYLRHAVGTKTFVTGHPIFENHLPGEPLVPGVILIEALAQLSGIVLIPPEGYAVRGYLAAVNRVRFRRLVHPDERIRLRSVLERRFKSVAIFEVCGEISGAEVASGSLTIGGMIRNP